MSEIVSEHNGSLDSKSPAKVKARFEMEIANLCTTSFKFIYINQIHNMKLLYPLNYLN